MPPTTPAPAGRSVLVAGATGLVGSEVVKALLADPSVGLVRVVTRKPLPVVGGRIDTVTVDFDHLERHRDAFAVRQVICALGTTIKVAGSREQFRRVDYEYPLSIARLALEQGAKHFLLVSALGANSESRIFYNRVKGDLEDQLRQLPFRSVTIVRPSMLLGHRAQPRRLEGLVQFLSRFIPGRYQGVQASAVARALVTAARIDAPGLRIIESDEIGMAGEA